jgi:GntR family transcriptional regulator, transcriptional repressor for pyruvate dehydrogenase complex
MGGGDDGALQAMTTTGINVTTSSKERTPISTLRMTLPLEGPCVSILFIIINLSMQAVPKYRAQKRGDMVVDEIKRWIAERRLRPGDKLPKEAALQQLFGVSKGTAREALKSLEVQGLVTVSTGPAGGATISEVPLERTFQLVQNYLFFRDLNVAQIYAIRRMLEPELAAGAVAYLTEADFEALEQSIDICAPAPVGAAQARAQRQEDLRFHDVLAAANPNVLLRFVSR